MPAPQKTRVFRNGRSQAVRIPTDHQLRGSEVHAYPDEGAGGPIPSKDGPADWDRIFRIIDKAGFPEDFMTERNQGTAEVREPL